MLLNEDSVLACNSFIRFHNMVRHKMETKGTEIVLRCTVHVIR